MRKLQQWRLKPKILLLETWEAGRACQRERHQKGMFLLLV